MASWCILTGFPPDVYNSLSRLEREEFLVAKKKTLPRK